MRKLIVIHYQKQNYDIGGLVRALIQVFNTEKYREILLKKYEFEVITSLDIINKLNKSEEEYINEINCDDMHLKDAVIFGIHPYGLAYADRISSKAKKCKNIKTSAWINDPHYFAYFVEDRKLKDITVQKYAEKYTPIFIEKLDYLVSPSLIYFKNLNILNYDHKLVDIFYFLPYHQSDLNFLNYPNRLDQIILSGARGGGYVSRNSFNMLKQNSDAFFNLIYVLDSPGYKNNEHMTEMNYYNKLSEFKGAFVGHHEFPLNYLLAKHIEVLMCGCLGFFEPNPLLESQLGLKEYVHYIPCYKDGKLINDPDFYKEWLKNGEEIARNGQKFVMENFGEKQIHKLFQFLADIK